MSDITSGGAGGIIGAAFSAGVIWASKFLKGNGSKDMESKAREMGIISAELAHLKTAVDALNRAATENQERIGELAGNVQSLTAIITRHFKP